MAAKSKLPEPHLFKLLKAQGKAEGKAEGELEAARRLVGHGVAWEIITDATGVRPVDLGLHSANKPGSRAGSVRKPSKK